MDKKFDNVEKIEVNHIEQDIKELKNEIEKTQTHYANVANRVIERFNDISNPSEGIVSDEFGMQALLIKIMNNQARSTESERNQIEKYVTSGIYRSKHNRGEDIGDSDESNEEFEDFKLNKLSIDQFENFILSDEGFYIIRSELEKHIDPETGKFYSNYPISEELLGFKLRTKWNSTLFKEYYTKFDEDIDPYISDMRNIIEDKVDNLIGEHIKNGGKNFDIKLINNFEGLFDEINILLGFSGDIDQSELDKERLEQKKDLLINFLEGLICNFSDLVYKDGEISLDTGQDQLDLQLKSYLYLYAKLFFPELLPENKSRNGYDTNFVEITKLVLSKYNPELEAKIKNKKLLEEKKKADQARKEREIKRRQDAERRNRERNNNLNTQEDFGHRGLNHHSDDSEDNSGVKLVKKSKIELDDFGVGGESTELLSEDKSIEHKAFNIAWNDFISYNDKLKNIITYPDILKLYNIKTGMIDENAWKSFLKTDIMIGRTNEEIDKILESLRTFPSKFNNAMRNITSNIDQRRGKMDDEIKMHALGAVIDNVKDVFNSIVEKWKGNSKFTGFLFDSHEPVRRERNDIIISGKFNGADIKIRYNLFSGELFMNSFLQHLSAYKVTIGNNTDTDYKIGQLESFDTILDEHYHKPGIPTHSSSLGNDGNRDFNNKNNGGESESESDLYKGPNKEDIDGIASDDKKSNITDTPDQIGTHTVSQTSNISKEEINALRKEFGDMINTNIDLIGDYVINHTKKQSAINSVITKFMKTFNIISDDNIGENIDVSAGSNMFDFLQIIENSDSTSLERFQTFMEKIMEYSGLTRGTNNLLGSQKNQKSEFIYDGSNNSKYVSLLKECSNNFSDNLDNLKGKLNFDNNSQLGFIKMICENITDNIDNKPNWKLDVARMDDFVYHLENDDK